MAMSATEELELMRQLAPFVVLALVAGAVGGYYLAEKARKQYLHLLGIVVMSTCMSSLAGSVFCILQLYQY